jgi:hypothetical protein
MSESASEDEFADSDDDGDTEFDTGTLASLFGPDFAEDDESGLVHDNDAESDDDDDCGTDSEDEMDAPGDDEQPSDPVDTAPAERAVAAAAGMDLDVHADPLPDAPDFEADWAANKIVDFHMDLEHAGEEVGIIQISVIAVDPYSMEELGRHSRYIKTPEYLHKFWNMTGADLSHGLKPSSPQFDNAQPLRVEWPKLVDFMESKLDGGAKAGRLVAWGGKGCDVEWFFKTTELCSEQDQGVFRQPKWTPYFWDPIVTINRYQSCPLNLSKSKIVGYGLGTVYCFVTGEDELAGAHNSLVDVLAQIEIVRWLFHRPKKVKGVSQSWLATRHGPKGTQLLTCIYKTKREKRSKALAEATRPVPNGWDDAPVSNEHPSTGVPRDMDYDRGSDGGGPHGPSPPTTSCQTLLDLWYFFVTIAALDAWAQTTEKYAVGDWVQPKAYPGRKRPSLMPVKPQDEEGWANRRHRFKPDTKNHWRSVTRHSLMVFFGILLATSAMGVRNVEQVWTVEGGTDVPWIRNAMTRDAFVNIRRHLHFVDNDALPEKGDHRWSPLQKVMPVITHFGAVFRRGWRLGKNLVVDESMIKYSGRAISWVQYMPAKPIKHGIKVFSLCCADSAYLASFEIYTGASEGVDGSAAGVIGRLLENAAVTAGTGLGRVMYTDNFYTGMALALFRWCTYRMYLVGTHRLSTKLSRTAADFPFAKLSNAALKSVERGWLRSAVREIDCARIANMWVQCIVWKDKKQVAFFSNYAITDREGRDEAEIFCERRTRGKGSKTIPCHPTGKKYSAHYNGVDRADRDVSDWGLDLGPSPRWYLRIVFWLISMAVHNIFCIVVDLAATSPAHSSWRVYTKNDGRKKFQLDLAHVICRAGIEGGLAEEQRRSVPHKKRRLDSSLDKRPGWMNQIEWHPCGCKKCWHCNAGITRGTAHRQVYAGSPKDRPRKKPAPSSPPFKANPGHSPEELIKHPNGNSGRCDVCLFAAKANATASTTYAELEKQAKQTRYCCPECNFLRICTECSGSYRHDLIKPLRGGAAVKASL